MRLILRCVLALIAVVGCIHVVSRPSRVLAQQCCNPNYCSLPPPNCPTPLCNQYGGTCSFYWTCNSPIVLDLRKEGFHLTNEADGVLFKFGDTKKQVAWTDPRFGNAWLALDRNGNGTIDDATELFGNFTPQPPSANPNGFRAVPGLSKFIATRHRRSPLRSWALLSSFVSPWVLWLASLI